MAPAGPPAKAAADVKAKVKKEKKEKNAEEESVPKLPEPDRADFDAKAALIQTDIDKFQKKQQDLNKQIGERSGGKDEFFQKKALLRAELDEYSSQMHALQEKKGKYKEQVGAAKEEGRTLRDNLNKMKKSVGYTNEHDIDERIRDIEYTMSHDSHSLKDEKKMMDEIKELKKCKPKVSQVNKLENDLSNRDSGGSTKEQIQAINEQLNGWYEKKKSVSEKLLELNEGRKFQLGDLPEIIAERDALGDQIREKIKERNSIRDEFRAAERVYKDYLYQLRQVRQEKAAKERDERQKEYNQQRLLRKAEQLDEQPYVGEITLVEQTISWCMALNGTKGQEEKKEVKEIAHNNKDGETILLKKDDREDEFFFAPTKGKKKGKAAGGAKKTEGGSAKPIKHNVETFQLFEKLKLDAPITTNDIPATLEKLEVQLADYKKKVGVWELKREEMKKRILAGDASDDEAEGEAAAEKDEPCAAEAEAAEAPAAEEAAEEATAEAAAEE